MFIFPVRLSTSRIGNQYQIDIFPAQLTTNRNEWQPLHGWILLIVLYDNMHEKSFYDTMILV